MRSHLASPEPESTATPSRGRRLLAALGFLAALAGCATPLDARKDTAYQQNAAVANHPVVRPTRSVSSFSESLTCMDRMLRDAQLPKLDEVKPQIAQQLQQQKLAKFQEDLRAKAKVE